MAEKIVNAIQSTGGVMCMEDLEKAMTDVLVIEDTVMVEYRGYKLYSMPLPSSRRRHRRRNPQYHGKQGYRGDGS